MLKGYKTVLFNAIMTLAMLLSLSTGQSIEVDPNQVTQFVDSLDLVVTFVWGAGNLLIRIYTNTEIFKGHKNEG